MFCHTTGCGDWSHLDPRIGAAFTLFTPRKTEFNFSCSKKIETFNYYHHYLVCSLKALSIQNQSMVIWNKPRQCNAMVSQLLPASQRGKRWHIDPSQREPAATLKSSCSHFPHYFDTLTFSHCKAVSRQMWKTPPTNEEEISTDQQFGTIPTDAIIHLIVFLWILNM